MEDEVGTYVARMGEMRN